MDHHRSREFIDFLKALDRHYQAEWTIRVVLDTHAAHLAKETRAYLALGAPGDRLRSQTGRSR